MFQGHNITLDRTSIDIKEIESDPFTVVAHKATQAGDHVLIEDTSLDIEGAEVGINIRWVMSNIEQYIGRKAVWTVLLGYKDGESIYIYKGVTNGHLVAPRVHSDFGYRELCFLRFEKI